MRHVLAQGKHSFAVVTAVLPYAESVNALVQAVQAGKQLVLRSTLTTRIRMHVV